MARNLIIDCFNIYNEIEVLFLRLDYLYDAVDYFVIVESLDSHSKKVRKTSYMFEDNILLFQRFLPKIRYLKLDNLPFEGDTGQIWLNENFQKNCCNLGLNGIRELKETDWILFSDVDEIPRRDILLQLDDHSHYQILQFQQHLFYYYVNLQQAQIWQGTVAVQLKNFTSMMEMRNLRNAVHQDLIFSFPDAGWHYSYMGGQDRILIKMDSYAESDENISFKTQDNITRALVNHTDIFDRNQPAFQKRIVNVFSENLSPSNLSRVLSLFPELFFQSRVWK
jgi:beta-1,4-mannosyl-glycoprotein beta-1,4-N-acetylglucosaminyltransferase